MVTVTLYTREGCHLCDDAKSVLETVKSARPFELVVVDIDRDPALVALYSTEVPVVAVAGRKAFKYRLTAGDLLAKLARAEADSMGAP